MAPLRLRALSVRGQGIHARAPELRAPARKPPEAAVGAGLAGSSHVRQLLDVPCDLAAGQAAPTTHPDHAGCGAYGDWVKPVVSSIALHGVSRLC